MFYVKPIHQTGIEIFKNLLRYFLDLCENFTGPRMAILNRATEGDS